jgi:uncharacterized protein (DUF2249 family)
LNWSEAEIGHSQSGKLKMKETVKGALVWKLAPARDAGNASFDNSVDYEIL